MTCTYEYSHFIHFKTVATEVEIQFLSTLIMFPSLLPQIGSAFFSSKEGGCPSTLVHIMNVIVMMFGDSFLTQGLHLNIWNILNILVHSSSNRFEMSNQPSGIQLGQIILQGLFWLYFLCAKILICVQDQLPCVNCVCARQRPHRECTKNKLFSIWSFHSSEYVL